ncbi:MAG TPA: acetyl/propionyl/methylcrotonyl-CoA carboxylase subunit alpha [Arenicellales bacterium]|nr:acetyl/propionyl-CoA carboxylase subunit alpha [Acidiferrobacteraceae bacterium]MDP7218700.1 acetyl/propionyl/methylcrotonyl-CoA carboxylase subunit alpha [Arenicellales bacterium]HCF72363.1 acetyl/propionyl-CoA carboxylase subunit alpha [Gammaproteobacteria bacterium]HJP09045.1 acetyl/propionyl/methylcrotonyl-CoA carboxylase subunit alpha [Arenicellales bacterium]
MFTKVLIANRGEIACRVIRTLRQLGIKSVAVYSDADRDALHTVTADEALRIGPPPSSESYLLIDQMVEACSRSGAQAVHPGYGFLAENSLFVDALDEAGISFIGPSSRAIRIMGDKIASKKLAREAGISVIPGHGEALHDADEAVGQAALIGYPVMLKASAGGGGKGMRIAANEEQCREGFERARSEARSSFGDDRVLIEKYINEPRHIEIQVLGDQHGNCVHLNERECSIQRRHQKIIEEAPSPFLDPATRGAMGEQAVMLAQAVDYYSAGTVEFIVDQERNFYFLEMNTRLQVEHPVTEEITGLDLVELMLKVAAGEKLPFTQPDIQIDGWALECRIYAEDPARGFLPSTGRLTRYQPPVEDQSIRMDSGVVEGGEVSVYYDPMVAKLVSRGPDRKTAIAAMGRGLDRFHVQGVSTNIPFLAAVLAHPRFGSGQLTTGFIAEEYPDGFDMPKPVGALHYRLIVLAVVLYQRSMEQQATLSDDVALPGARVVWVDGESFDCVVELLAHGYAVTCSGQRLAMRTCWWPGQSVCRFECDDGVFFAKVERDRIIYRVSHAGTALEVMVLDPLPGDLYRHMPVGVSPDQSHLVLSPMSGLLVSISVTEGQAVQSGQEVAVIEAMKMENALKSERDGIVVRTHARQGDTVELGQALIEFESGSER